MGGTQNPFGLHTVTPYIIVSDVPELILFLQSVFDAKLRGAIKYRKDETVQHAEITIGDSVIMMGEPMDDLKSSPCTLYVYVEDCDEVYSKALKIGAHSVLEPTNYPHGDRYGGVKDFAGNIWWIVTHIGTNL